MMELWSPSEGIEATTELMEIITCNESVAVLAGAGTGKTELLAQKANYLFFTDECIWPKRILSLTFKTEAQKNIKNRVNSRCGNKADRFDSYTFHAFCKSIVDRFKNILPESDRPLNNYDLVQKSHEANGTDKILMGSLLVLAIKILKASGDVREMFLHSYSHVFVDEFQDTTGEQYELLQLLFQGGDTKVLAVGDINQSIMLWAKAKKGVFNDFISDFSAQKKLLVKNYRSSQAIQESLAVFLQYIERPLQPIPMLPTQSSSCSLHVFEDERQEATFIAEDIKKAIAAGVTEGDICIVTKQHSSQYTEFIRSELTAAGINNLDMNDLQDALKEQLGQLFSLFLKALITPNPKVMTEIYEITLMLNNIERGDKKEESLAISLSNFILQKQALLTTNSNVNDLLSCIQSFIQFLGPHKVKGRWKQYKSPDYYNHIWRVLEAHLRDMCSQTASLEDASKLFSAENSVQVMNIHKCKGLEYHSVYFIGLEDQAFWSYSQEPFENNCAIYVAMSRAREQLLVTYSKYRSHRIRGRYDDRYSSYDIIRPAVSVLINKCKFLVVEQNKVL